MKNLSLTFCLVIVVLFGSVKGGFASSCQNNPKGCNNIALCIWSINADTKRWDSNYPNHVKEAKRRGLYFKNISFGVNKYANCGVKRTTSPNTPLKSAFVKLSKENRKKLQFNLKDLGFYKSSIDGLYGKGTVGALSAYNKQNLNGSDLKKSENVEKLFNAVLALKPSPKPKPKPKTQTDEETKPKRDLEKEFGLSLYGTFLHSEKVPNALFFFDEIEQYDSFEFRKALRNHDVDLIVLSSPGGSIFEGLNMAGIIHDKELNTYIPQNSLEDKGDCASACSFMFFAGATRNVEGKLGVHQFYSNDGSKKEEVGDTQKTAQFTVSEIIGFLNEFETPAWVYERMFQQSDMYYFKEKELVQLETEVSDELMAHYGKSEKFIMDLSKAFAEVAE